MGTKVGNALYSSNIKILLIGLGYHAKRIYFPVMETDGSHLNAEIAAVIDIEEKREDIEKFISERAKRKIETMFIKKNDRAKGGLTQQTEKQIDHIIHKHGITAVFICTEPLAHKEYASFALKRGLHILMDKPVTTRENVSTDPAMAKGVLSDYNDLINLKKQCEKKFGQITFSLMAQRRYHPAFKKVKELIKEVHLETGCPITSFQSFHSDGQWRMPIEIINQDYHPYNQGYGKISHSGYHSLDLVPWLLEAAESDTKRYDQAEIFSQAVRPRDFMEQINFNDYKALFPDYEKYMDIDDIQIKNRVHKYGEIDAFSTIALKHAGKNMTIGSFNLAHNGFAQRNWVTAQGRDLYKGNGRVRHETHYFEQGPFQAISFISYQGNEINEDNIKDCYGVGGEYHLDIHVFRNDKMFPKWKNYEKITVRDLNINIMEGYSRGHQEDARRCCIIEFIQQVRNPGSTKKETFIEDHSRSVVLMSAIYQSLCKQFNSGNPKITMDFTKNNINICRNKKNFLSKSRLLPIKERTRTLRSFY